MLSLRSASRRPSIFKGRCHDRKNFSEGSVLPASMELLAVPLCHRRLSRCAFIPDRFLRRGFLAGFFSDKDAVIQQAALCPPGFPTDCVLTCALFAFSGFYTGHGMTSGSCPRAPAPPCWCASRYPALLPHGGAAFFHPGLATPITTACGIMLYLGCCLHMRRRAPELVRDRAGFPTARQQKSSPRRGAFLS